MTEPTSPLPAASPAPRQRASPTPPPGAGATAVEDTPLCISQHGVWFADSMVCLGNVSSLECFLMGLVWGFGKMQIYV